MLLPHRAFTIETTLAPDEVQARLRAGVEARQWPRFSRSSDVPFEGVVEGTRFEVRRIIRGRNSFLPQVRGLVEPTAGGTRLVGTMQLHGAVAAFMLVAFLGVGLVSLTMVPRAFTGGRFDPTALIPLGVLAFLVVTVLGGFVPEAGKALRELARLVDASHAKLR